MATFFINEKLLLDTIQEPLFVKLNLPPDRFARTVSKTLNTEL